MILDQDSTTDEYRVLCERCNHVWLYERYEIILDPWPHFECPHCGEWIPVF